jgi:hypothetical protein
LLQSINQWHNQNEAKHGIWQAKKGINTLLNLTKLCRNNNFFSQQHILLYKVQYNIFDYVEYIYVTMLESVVELGAMATRGMDFWYLKYKYCCLSLQ